MSIVTGIIAELEARHHSKEFLIKAKIEGLNASIVKTSGLSENTESIIKCLMNEREELEAEYRREVYKFECYMNRKREREEKVETGAYELEEATRYIEYDAIREFFDD